MGSPRFHQACQKYKMVYKQANNQFTQVHLLKSSPQFSRLPQKLRTNKQTFINDVTCFKLKKGILSGPLCIQNTLIKVIILFWRKYAPSLMKFLVELAFWSPRSHRSVKILQSRPVLWWFDLRLWGKIGKQTIWYQVLKKCVCKNYASKASAKIFCPFFFCDTLFPLFI